MGIDSPREQILSFKGSPDEEGDGHRLSQEKVHLFPLLKRINKFSEVCLPYIAISFQIP